MFLVFYCLGPTVSAPWLWPGMYYITHHNRQCYNTFWITGRWTTPWTHCCTPAWTHSSTPEQVLSEEEIDMILLLYHFRKWIIDALDERNLGSASYKLMFCSFLWLMYLITRKLKPLLLLLLWKSDCQMLWGHKVAIPVSDSSHFMMMISIARGQNTMIHFFLILVLLNRIF